MLTTPKTVYRKNNSAVVLDATTQTRRYTANPISEFTCFASQRAPNQSLNGDIKLCFSE